MTVRIPSVVAWQHFRQSRPTLFAGTAEGIYLQNRIEEAFYEGWNAAEEAVRASTRPKDHGEQ